MPQKLLVFETTRLGSRIRMLKKQVVKNKNTIVFGFICGSKFCNTDRNYPFQGTSSPLITALTTLLSAPSPGRQLLLESSY